MRGWILWDQMILQSPNGFLVTEIDRILTVRSYRNTCELRGYP